MQSSPQVRLGEGRTHVPLPPRMGLGAGGGGEEGRGEGGGGGGGGGAGVGVMEEAKNEGRDAKLPCGSVIRDSGRTSDPPHVSAPVPSRQPGRPAARFSASGAAVAAAQSPPPRPAPPRAPARSRARGCARQSDSQTRCAAAGASAAREAPVAGRWRLSRRLLQPLLLPSASARRLRTPHASFPHAQGAEHAWRPTAPRSRAACAGWHERTVRPASSGSLDALAGYARPVDKLYSSKIS